MLGAIESLAAVCGLEAPPYEKGREMRVSEGRTYCYAKGMDIPAWVENNWADAGVTGEDACLECPVQERILWQAIGQPVCRYSLLVVEGTEKTFEYSLEEARWNGRAAANLKLPATRPRTLEAMRGNLPISPLGVPIRGSGELAILLSGCQAGTDIVQTGKSAARAGLVEYQVLGGLSSAIVTRRQP
jgi:ATP phosphoribosyltransferase